MDLDLLSKGIEFTRRRKKWVILLGAIGVTSYGAYKAYYSPSMVKKRNRLLKVLTAITSVVEAASDSAEVVGVVSRDLKEFLQSDSDEIPNSLRQISKIANSSEFSASVVKVTESLTSGILKGYRLEAGENVIGGSGGGEMNVQGSSGFYDQFMDRLFSSAGSGFASVVVGSFARNLVLGFYSDKESNCGQNSSQAVSAQDSEPGWVSAICNNENCREVVGDCIQLFVSTAVTVYLDKTMNINTYDEFFAGMTNPKHESKVRDLAVTICNSAIETVIKTSHKVLTRSNSAGLSSPGISQLVFGGSSSLGNSTPNADQSQTQVERKGSLQEELLDKLKAAIPIEEKRDPSWVSRMSSTLAVPSNRRFVLDVTGRVTFETVRSFLYFLLEKVVDGLKRGFNAVRHALVDRGLEVVRYVSAKSSVVAAICLSLCLHVVSGGAVRVLMPA